jgi:hypothetical protein
MSGFLTREQILKADDLQTEIVPCPEWGGDVAVSAMTGQDRDEYERSCLEVRGKSVKQNLDNMRAKLAAATIVDQAGARLFTAADVKALGKKSAAALDRVFSVAQRLNKLTEDDLEELAGNS